MKITLNGDEKELPLEMTISKLLSELAIDELGTAVAVNGEIVSRKEFDKKTVLCGDAVDILRAIGGG